MHVAEQISNLLRRPTRLGVLAVMIGGSLALTSMNLAVYAHSRISTTTARILWQKRTVAANGQKTTISFRPQSLQNSTRGVPGGWGQVKWPTANVAWAWIQPHMNGGFLEHTTNGGKTWSFWYTPRIEWSQVAAIGAQSVSLLGQRLPNPHAIHPHPPLLWLHTTNGGRVWTRWTLTSPPLGHSINTTAIFPRTGFQALGVDQGGQFWWTRGVRWHTLWPSSDRVTAITFIPGQGEEVAVQTTMHTNWAGRITVSANGQVTTGGWTQTPDSITGMDWFTSTDGWVWSPSELWHTTNGGITWTALGPWPGTRWSGGQLIMTSAQTGFAAVESTNGGPPWDYTELWRTRSAGRTWTRIRLPVIHYQLPNFTGTLVGFDVAAVRPPHTLTLWYGPVSGSGGLPQRIWSPNAGNTWHLANHQAVEPGTQ
ncbi:MAG: hypothetical protein M1600_05830 [Firmicutes bacterium]|jgi:hypothetical protein|nr:hypothetical protein [Bacillota bacterium]